MDLITKHKIQCKCGEGISVSTHTIIKTVVCEKCGYKTFVFIFGSSEPSIKTLKMLKEKIFNIHEIIIEEIEKLKNKEKK